MFSGIVETTSLVIGADLGDGILQLFIEQPKDFTDLEIGASVAVDGVCLTLEEFDGHKLKFALGPETTKVTGWTGRGVVGRAVNLERSLRLSDRVHGHLVTGHVDATVEVVEAVREGETLRLKLSLAESLGAFVWAKGSVALNGVSLTVNSTEPAAFTVGLIPETLRRTNLNHIRVGHRLNFEIDNWARGLVHWAKNQRETSEEFKHRS